LFDSVLTLDVAKPRIDRGHDLRVTHAELSLGRS